MIILYVCSLCSLQQTVLNVSSEEEPRTFRRFFLESKHQHDYLQDARFRCFIVKRI